MGSPLVVSLPEPLVSSPSEYMLCPTKRRRGSTTESPSTSHGSVVTVSSGATETFHRNMDDRNCAVPSSRHFVLHDTHIADQQHLAQQKSVFFDCLDR